MRILLVEDTQTTAMLIGSVLRAAGHTVEVIDSVAGLRLRLRGYAPDAVLLDWVLADGDAGHILLEVCGSWPPSRVIILTALSMMELPPLPSSVTLLLKPVSREVLLRSVAFPARKG